MLEISHLFYVLVCLQMAILDVRYQLLVMFDRLNLVYVPEISYMWTLKSDIYGCHIGVQYGLVHAEFALVFTFLEYVMSTTKL